MYGQQSDEARRQAASAQRLVTLSHIFGWGGLGMLFAIAPGLGVATGSGMLGLVLAGVGGVSAVVGAILGQIGRGMQGRVI